MLLSKYDSETTVVGIWVGWLNVDHTISNFEQHDQEKAAHFSEQCLELEDYTAPLKPPSSNAGRNLSGTADEPPVSSVWIYWSHPRDNICFSLCWGELEGNINPLNPKSPLPLFHSMPLKLIGHKVGRLFLFNLMYEFNISWMRCTSWSKWKNDNCVDNFEGGKRDDIAIHCWDAWCQFDWFGGQIVIVINSSSTNNQAHWQSRTGRCDWNLSSAEKDNALSALVSIARVVY